MDRPIYSFEFTQSGKNMIVDACVPLAIGHEIFRLVTAAAKAHRVPIASKRTIQVPKDPEFQLRSATRSKPRTSKASKSTKAKPKGGERHKPGAPGSLASANLGK
jgi:hypothetical protein